MSHYPSDNVLLAAQLEYAATSAERRSDALRKVLREESASKNAKVKITINNKSISIYDTVRSRRINRFRRHTHISK